MNSISFLYLADESRRNRSPNSQGGFIVLKPEQHLIISPSSSLVARSEGTDHPGQQPQYLGTGFLYHSTVVNCHYNEGVEPARHGLNTMGLYPDDLPLLIDQRSESNMPWSTDVHTSPNSANHPLLAPGDTPSPESHPPKVQARLAITQAMIEVLADLLLGTATTAMPSDLNPGSPFTACSYHGPILNFISAQSNEKPNESVNYIDHCLTKDPAEQYAVFEKEDSKRLSINKQCSCETVGLNLEISEDEEEYRNYDIDDAGEEELGNSSM